MQSEAAQPNAAASPQGNAIEEPLLPKYDVSKVEAEVLKVVGEHLPQHLVIGALLMEVIADPSDAREVGVGTRAIHSLIEVGLFTQELDESVVPTEAGLRAVELLT